MRGGGGSSRRFTAAGQGFGLAQAGDYQTRRYNQQEHGCQPPDSALFHLAAGAAGTPRRGSSWRCGRRAPQFRNQGSSVIAGTLQSRGKSGNGFITHVRAQIHCAIGSNRQVRSHIWIEFAGSFQGGQAALAAQGIGRRLPGEQSIQCGSQAVYVAGGCDFCLAGLFGGCETANAQANAQTGKSGIYQINVAARGNANIGGFDVEVKSAFFVQISQRLADGLQPGNDQVIWQRPILVEQRLQVHAVNVVADQVLARVFQVEVVAHGRQLGMAQPNQTAGFGAKKLLRLY